MFSDSPLVWGQVKGKFATKGLVNYTSLGGRGKGKGRWGSSGTMTVNAGEMKGSGYDYWK